MNYKIVKLNKDNRKFLSDSIKLMEKDIYYPLGEDSFKIDHGDDYFKFFERLGELHYWCVFDNDILIGVAAGILRFVENKKTWYLCDLKVLKEYRGKGIPKLIFKHAFLYNLFKQRVFRAYAVSMNDGSKNLPFKKIKRSTFNLLKVNNKLNIYTLNQKQHQHFIKNEGLFLTNTNGCKELILRSTEKRMDLYHLTNDINKLSKDEPNKDSVVMLSAFEGSLNDEYLKKICATHNSDATVLTFRLDKIKNIYTDEI